MRTKYVSHIYIVVTKNYLSLTNMHERVILTVQIQIPSLTSVAQRLASGTLEEQARAQFLVTTTNS